MPDSDAAFVFGLAKETGWSEHFILWELPYARALQYFHALLWANGQWTVPVVEQKDLQKEFEISYALAIKSVQEETEEDDG